jgi:hypothetical protein
MPWRALVLGLSLALAAAEALAAPPPTAPAATVEGVTVQAPKPLPERLPEQVNRFVGAHSAISRINHLSRWAGPICPQTYGLTPDLNAFVTARVKIVAADIGAPAARDAKAGDACSVNVLVVFTTTPQALMDDVRDNHSKMLGFHYFAQAKRLATVTRAVQAWYMTGSGGKHQIPEPDDEFRPMPGGAAGSRLSDGLTSKFMAVLVVVDTAKVAGREIGAVADNIAMLTLAHSLPGKTCSELSTIVDLLNPACPEGAEPTGLTPYDRAYLRALYAIEPTEFLAAQRSEIGTHILKELTAAP